MRLTHLALLMALALLGATAWLAMDARWDAKSARNKLELYQRQNGQARAGDAAAVQAQENQLLMKQMSGKSGAPARASDAGVAIPPVPAPIPAPAPVSPKIHPGHVSAAAMESTPPPLTQRQRMVLSVPAIGTVKEYHKDYGFVIITAGTTQKIEKGMTFAVRRGPGIIGRIKITEVENADAVGNLDPRSIPAGVDIESGDAVIQDLPPEA